MNSLNKVDSFDLERWERYSVSFQDTLDTWNMRFHVLDWQNAE